MSSLNPLVNADSGVTKTMDAGSVASLLLHITPGLQIILQWHQWHDDNTVPPGEQNAGNMNIKLLPAPVPMTTNMELSPFITDCMARSWSFRLGLFTMMLPTHAGCWYLSCISVVGSSSYGWYHHKMTRCLCTSLDCGRKLQIPMPILTGKSFPGSIAARCPAPSVIKRPYISSPIFAPCPNNSAHHSLLSFPILLPCPIQMDESKTALWWLGLYSATN